MEVIIIVAVFALAAYLVDRSKRKRRNRAKPIKIEAITGLPTGKWGLVDECSSALEGVVDVESNGGGDMLCTLAYEVSRRGTKPAFIGVTHDPKHTDKTPTMKIIEALAINVPVLQGGHSYEPEQSELGLAIIEETVKGEFDIVLGSPAGDLEWAFKNGAHVHNVTTYALLRGTWNEFGDDGMAHRQTSAMKKSAAYVAQRLGNRLIEVTLKQLYLLLRVENLPNEFKDTRAFIERNRDLKAWDIAFSDSVIKRNQQLNSNVSSGSLRIADVLAMVKLHGDDVNDAGAILNHIQNGLNIFKDRIARGAKNTIVQTPAVPKTPLPDTKVDRSTFNQSRVRLHRGHINPFTYKETSKLTEGRIVRNKYWTRHTKDGTWKGKPWKDNNLIDGCDGIIAFNRLDSTWYVFMYEYSVRGIVFHHKGWGELEWVKQGDPIGMISTTNILEPKWNIAGQAKERTNILWTVAE